MGWALILLKCVLASIAIRHWSIPIEDFYVWGLSFMLGGLGTGLYLSRDRQRCWAGLLKTRLGG